MSIKQRCRRTGFTLIELLVVLAVLAAITVVAVESMAPVASEARRDSTARTLGSVASAIISVNKSNVSGFLADTGRLPAHSIVSFSPVRIRSTS